MFHEAFILLCLFHTTTKSLRVEKPPCCSARSCKENLTTAAFQTQNSHKTQEEILEKKIPAVYREGAQVACLFQPTEPELVVDQYLADIDAAIVVICS